MPQFAFVAKDRLGNVVQGKLDALDAALAANEVGRMGYVLIQLAAVDGASPAPVTATPEPTRAMPPAASLQPDAAPAASPPDPNRTAQRATPLQSSAPALAAAPQGAGQAAPDILQADAERRRKTEADLARMGMKPDEIRRLLDANANTAAPAPGATVLPGLSPLPQSAAPPRTAKEAARQKLAARAADLQSFAAQLQSANAASRVQAVEAIALDLPAFRESTREEKEQAETMLREVFALKRRERYVEALAKCREAIERIPGDAAALEMYGDILQGLARTDEAMAAYKRATEADAKRASAERKYGDLMMRQQRWSEADPEEVPKSPVAAAVFSLLIPGAGQIHVGQTVKGAILIACAALAMGALIYLTRDQTPYETSVEKRSHAAAKVRRERTHFDPSTQWPIVACVGFYAMLGIGSAIDAANAARLTRR
ncbi:MAG TPA: hypothetical protein VKT77_10320 [Chthonomonadaceae bacterium]|nr:hypothetical protein [Chthonomonadaceae bacterium]